MNNVVPFQASTNPELPHNLDAEQRLLGSIFVNNRTLDRPVVVTLRPNHFYEPLHGRIFGAAMLLCQRGQLANPVTLRNMFEADPALQAIGGFEYLSRLTTSSVSPAYADNYAKHILETWQRRELILLCQEASEKAKLTTLEDDGATQVRALSARLDDIVLGSEGEGLRPFSDALNTALEQIGEAAKNPGRITGVRTSLDDVDRIMGGMEPSQLIVAAGRPGMGKTALAETIASNAGVPTAIFSQEMSSAQLAKRALSAKSGIPLHVLRSGRLKTGDFERLGIARADLLKAPIHVDDAANQSPMDILAKARAFKRKHGLGLIIVDHMQIMRGPAKSYQNRTAELTDISKGLKAVAKDLNVPVVALCQLSRAVEQREEKRPQLSDLRESGSIEQDADVVLLLYRKAYYIKQREPSPDDKGDHDTWEIEYAAEKNRAEIIAAKVRDGDPGVAEVFFDPEHTSFRSLARSEPTRAA